MEVLASGGRLRALAAIVPLATIARDPNVWPIAAAVAGIGLSLVIAAPHWLNRRRARNGGDGGPPEDGTGTPHDRSEELTPELVS
jgi:hypothetical protein